jgi:hypothetical protein
MCESLRKKCTCGRNTAEIFFGRMILDERAVKRVYCPQCSNGSPAEGDSRVWDNGWVLELNMDVIRARAPIMEISPDRVRADWVFDQGFVTWVGYTPDDAKHRNRERAEILKLAPTDFQAYLKAMKEWGISREKRLREQGWRKARSA